MSLRTDALPRALTRQPAREVSAARRAADFFALTKPRMVLMIVVTTGVGFHLGSAGAPDILRLLHVVLGTALAAGGALALNQLLEREADAKMERTRLRPLPAGRLQPGEALAFGTMLAAAGPLYLGLRVNAVCGLVTAFTVVSYLFVYTPLKRRTSLCSVLGAIPGALPPVTGWVAARGDFGPGAWALFAILFLWQMPHSLAIGWLYRADYARAGFRLLPVIEPDGGSTARQIVGNCLALLAVGPLPTLMGLTGAVYFLGALVLGTGLLACGIVLAVSRSAVDARRLVFASLVYLPALLVLMALDTLPF
ncbi:MAG: protoheme IX farnesyltransferase [candidate division NC10 bacterium]|nr:protoheme IX farnesyltransferase [candidate division NC10 bacterium]